MRDQAAQTPAARVPQVARIAFGAGALVALLMALAHATAHFQAPVATTDDERTLFSLMQRVPISAIQKMTGQSRTLEDINTGFSWHFALSYAALAIACLGVRGLRPHDRPLFRLTAALAVLFLGVDLAISLRYFFLLPLCFTSASLACFIVAFVASSPPRLAD